MADKFVDIFNIDILLHLMIINEYIFFSFILKISYMNMLVFRRDTDEYLRDKYIIIIIITSTYCLLLLPLLPEYILNRFYRLTLQSNCLSKKLIDGNPIHSSTDEHVREQCYAHHSSLIHRWTINWGDNSVTCTLDILKYAMTTTTKLQLNCVNANQYYANCT